MQHHPNFRSATCLLATLILSAGYLLAQDITRLAIHDAREDANTPLCCLSGADTHPDGNLVIISDRGVMFEARVNLTENHLTVTRAVPLTLSDGKGLPKRRADAEGLAILPTGEAFISFERRHRIAQYNGALGVRAWDAPHLTTLSDNGGLEALAVDARGMLWAIPETPQGKGFPLLTLKDGLWAQVGMIPREGSFLPVGADFDDRGRLYVLERDFSLLRFRSRLRRITFSGSREIEIDTLFESNTGNYDNLEAVTIHKMPGGGLAALMISDDNAKFFQQTQAIYIRIPDETSP